MLTDPFLKSSFDTLLKLREVIHCILTVTAHAHHRIETLTGEGQAGICYGTLGWAHGCPLARAPARAVGKVVRVSNVNQPPSTATLILPSNLGPIRDKAKALYERTVTEGYVQLEADVLAVSGLAEDIRDAVLEYQVSNALEEPA